MDDSDIDTEIPGRTRGQRIAIIISSFVPLAAILICCVVMVLPLLREGGWGRINHGPRVFVSAASMRAILLPYGIIFLIAFPVTVIGLVRWAWTLPVALSEQFDPVGTREKVAWAGRPGWRSQPGSHLFLIALTLAAPCIFALWLWAIWSNASDPSVALFWTLLPIFFFFGSVVPGIVIGSDALREWIREAFGRVVITDRRIAWAAGRDQVYREIAGRTLTGAALVEEQGQRGWISISQRIGDDVHELDLFGLPEPDRALAAIERLMVLQQSVAISEEFPPNGG